jgi:hypothetical protein
VNNEITIDGIKYQRMDRVANRAATHLMFDCHAFDELKSNSIQGLVEEWQSLCMNEEYTRDYGKPYLCPVIIMDGDKELRRVGTMVFPDSRDCGEQLAKWIGQCKADPELERVLALRRNVAP